MSWFTFQEFNISNTVIPRDIQFKIREYHIKPLDRVRNKFGKSIIISKRSGWRPLWWEELKGRSGNSEHVFIDKGACDVTCIDFVNQKDNLLSLLISETKYTRIAEYKTFFHCDYKGGKRYLFNSNWEKIKEI